MIHHALAISIQMLMWHSTAISLLLLIHIALAVHHMFVLLLLQMMFKHTLQVVLLMLIISYRVLHYLRGSHQILLGCSAATTIIVRGGLACHELAHLLRCYRLCLLTVAGLAIIRICLNLCLSCGHHIACSPTSHVVIEMLHRHSRKRRML